MKKILAIDDQEDITYSIQRILSSKYDVVVCNNGKDAIEKLSKDKFDLILLDLMMPEMDGWAVLAEVRTSSDVLDNDVPIIILSALTDKVNKGMSEGQVKDYIDKPIDNDELLSRINAVIGN